MKAPASPEETCKSLLFCCVFLVFLILTQNVWFLLRGGDLYEALRGCRCAGFFSSPKAGGSQNCDPLQSSGLVGFSLNSKRVHHF